MAATPPHSPSTFVEMETPDIETPNWPYALRPQPLPPGSFRTPLHFSPSQASTHVRFVSPTPAGSTPIQPLTWEQERNADHMQICTSPVPSPVSSVMQQDLPGILPTPGKEMQQLTQRVQGNWDTLLEHMQTHEKNVGKLTQEFKTTSAHHDKLIAQLADKLEHNQQQVLACISKNKEDVKEEIDQLVKSVKIDISDELHKAQTTFVSESLPNAPKPPEHCTAMQDLQTGIKEKFQDQEKQLAGLKVSDPSPHPTTSESPAIPVTGPPPLTLPVIKSDHLKLTFPTFGRSSDDADPLLYLTRCQDFFALHPLTDADILATFRSVLYGTARDWWEVARSSITTWDEFESAFLSAFLSEDYEDELAERVRTRTQGDRECIRDFAFTYRALCKRWKPSLTDSELVKMILKNIKPYLASQLHSRVNTVDELVKLGQQLEKDYEQQQQYEGRDITHLATVLALSLLSPFNPPVKSIPPTTSTACKKTPPPADVPQQLVVPLSIGTWKGKAIVDTGASYTLLHENLCKELSAPNLCPWTRGPLYLANGEAEIPLGWWPADQKYSFKSNPNEDYPFQPGNASVPIIPTQHQKEKMENKSDSTLKDHIITQILGVAMLGMGDMA
ncbi:Activity-regulated cytoskeleton-associated protein [Labeo rohita]|uniref:Activity-regulated cytoskeleton-associated protein n=1 Tax=Labeo rohita TaxID=84645 RepID=A0ABQ8LBN9_LABRO|nr:Activity-regulated cytoskeleton-associated protein [Labeo rohita]